MPYRRMGHLRGTLPPDPAVRPIPMVWNSFPCLDFVNSEFNDHAGGSRRFDRLSLAEWQQAFLDHWGYTATVPVPAEKVVELRDIRSRLRGILESAPRGAPVPGSEVRALNRLLAASPFIYRIGDGQQVIAEPLERDWDWVVAELVRSTIEAVSRHEARRLKVCANADCSWLFYDESMNVSRRWCQTNVCGNLIKVREHRARRRRLRR